MNIKIPEQVLHIINTLENAGFEAYIVGGCVRDFLLGKIPKDWDITTSALPEQTKCLFPHTYDTGIEHGTITVVKDKVNYEVTTYRIDGSYVDFRHPTEVIFTKKVDEDLSRRDFTMNAIAYNDNDGFCDPFGGQDDIKNKLIKGVGDPDKRFNEDALRMLRGVRFSAQLNFDIEENTYNSILKNCDLIKNISAERIRDELTKLLLSPNPEKIVELKNTGLLKNILPMLEDEIYENSKIVNTLKNLAENNVLETSLFYCALLCDFTETEVTTIMKGLRFDTKTVRETATLVKYSKLPTEITPYEIRKILSRIDEPIYNKLIQIKKALFYNNEEELQKLENVKKELYKIVVRNDCYSLKSLEIDGNTLKEMGIVNGKNIGVALNFCLEKVLQNPENNNIEILKNFVIENFVS